MEEYKNILETLSFLTTIVGLPLAIYLFFSEKKKARLELELSTHNDLSKEYREFLKLCLEFPEFPIFDFNYKADVQLTEEFKTKNYLMFEILISMCESAFFQYRVHSSKLKVAQWSGWNEYMMDWCNREDFRRAWLYLGPEFDKDFVNHLNNLIKQCGSKLNEENTAS